jgi:hypothetical protein
MGPLQVVGREPSVGDLLHLPEGVKEIGVEDLLAIRAVEPFDEGVLIGLPGLNVADGNALRRTPLVSTSARSGRRPA